MVDSKQLEALADEMNILVLVTGTLTDGSAHYAYASVPVIKYLDFKTAEAAGNYDLAQFGTILAHGAGSEPSAEVKAQMEREHGANHRLEEELQAMLAQLNLKN